jgi:hypothetical protein
MSPEKRNASEQAAKYAAIAVVLLQCSFIIKIA